jgi:CRP/FNR family transcriptional regulator, cyclic AMP receptor protein
MFRRFGFLKDLSAEAIENLTRYCTWHHVTAGKEIIRVNEDTGDVYFIADGKVRILLYSASEGKRVVFTHLGPYEMVGEVSAIDGQARSATVEAEGGFEMATLKRDKFKQLICEHPDFAFAVLKVLASHVRRLSERVYEFSTLDVESRVLAELLRSAVPDGCPNNQALVSPAPRAEVAAKTSTAREAVSRVISKLGEEGIVKREGQDLRILDLQRLRELVIAAKGE